jgi:hypothetical protein
MFADDIQAAVGSESDFAGCFELIVRSIKQSQRFVISDEVVDAAKQLLQSRPSSLVNALPLCRVPYDNLWLEWNGEHAVGLNPDAPLRENAHKVKRMGCWISSTSKGRIGAANYAWQDPEGEIAFGGLGIAFTFEGDVLGMYELFGAKPPPEDTIEGIRQSRKPDNIYNPWAKFVHQSDAEAQAIIQLCKQAAPFPNPWMIPFYEKLTEQGISPDDPRLNPMYESWQHDIGGEAPFVFALLMLINSKNAVEQVPSDLTRLNKARAKIGKVPKFDYSVTRLSISRSQSRLGTAHGMDRQAVRQHLVRGHFKMRRTGVYWWSPFTRGAGRRLERDHYDVKR